MSARIWVSESEERMLRTFGEGVMGRVSIRAVIREMEVSGTGLGPSKCEGLLESGEELIAVSLANRGMWVSISNRVER